MIYIVDNNGTFSGKLKCMVLSHVAEAKLVCSENSNEFPAAKGVILTDGSATAAMLENNKKIINSLPGEVPVLGIGLGMRAIVEAFGGSYQTAPKSTISREANMIHDEDGVYIGIPSPVDVGQYSHLHVDEESLPTSLYITAHTWAGEVMGVRHRDLPIEGIHFHPGSVKTEHGDRIIQAFVEKALSAIERGGSR